MSKDTPSSTYRIQLDKKLNFHTVKGLVSYFYSLGISHLYLSPCLQTRQDSMHGYDISDFNSINSDLGTLSDLKELAQALKKYGMGLILDFVPNHMSIFDNPWWNNVLENGESSPYASFFDIDWHPVKAELDDRVLLPILEDFYGNVLDLNLLELAFDKGAFYIKYHAHSLPIDPTTYPTILSPIEERLSGSLPSESPVLIELQSIIAACRNLPGRTETIEEKRAERQREKEVIKRRLRNLCSSNHLVRGEMQCIVSQFNGRADGNFSHEQLHQLLEQQIYRLSYWLVAADEINYRRFFDINELAALNMENPAVFEASHRLLFELLGKKIIDGLRIDHVDGLFDPGEYFERLHEGYKNALKNELDRQQNADDSNISWIKKLFSSKPVTTDIKLDNNNVDPRLYMVVEKILCGEEKLRSDWQISGTTGYEFTNALNGIFINRHNAATILGIYSMFINRQAKFADILYESKLAVLQTSMAAELNVLAHRLDKLSEKSRHNRDFTLNSIREALQTLISCFPTYRTYINTISNTIDDNDRSIIVAAVEEAKKRNVSLNSLVFDFIVDSLLLKFPPDLDEEGKKNQRAFVMRFQQLTGPVMAKGLEDTAFYNFIPLLSLNEVGGNPSKFGNTMDKFHAQNLERAASFPDGMVSTSTHDSKRSEDVRARINVLSELPREWQTSLERWRVLNAGKKTPVQGEYAPDSNEEYYIYQTLAGSFPHSDYANKVPEQYTRRIKEHIVKALREAKVHSSWSNPRSNYEEACVNFIDSILSWSSENLFLADFLKLNRIIIACGMYNSLSQTVLKIFSPGVPDLYRGNEVWIYDLTDPDNRRHISFTRRRQMLQQMQKMFKNGKTELALCQDMTENPGDGRIKLYVTWKSLNCRRRNEGLFSSHNYLPLSPEGKRRNHVCSFLRRNGDKEILVVAPVLIAGLTRKAKIPPTGADAWSDTLINLPSASEGKAYRNIFTGEHLTAEKTDGKVTLEIAKVLNVFPVAALETVKE